MDNQSLKDLALKLLAVASIFDPKDAAILKLLVEVAGEFQAILSAIRNQTEADAPEVWAQVSADFNLAADEFEKAVKENE